MTALRAWRRDERGSVALMFGLVLVVMMTAIGAAFDFSRATSAKADLQRAIDAAALLVAKNRDAGDSTVMADQVATDYVRSTFGVSRVSNLIIKVTFQDDKVRVEGSGSIPTTVSNIVGITNVPVAGSAEVMYGNKVEIALVLDNTGSMAQLNKLPTLKSAVGKFLKTMQAATNPNSVRFALVPFDTDVKAPSASAWWIDQGPPGSPPPTGCLLDRDQPNDVQDTAPVSSIAATLFSADTLRTTCTLSPMVPLTSDYRGLQQAVDGMTASGNTNLTVGLAWGLHMLTNTEPMTGAAALNATGVSKYIVFMTDGLNTQNRWSTDPTAIDARTRQVCDTIRSANIKVFTARIIDGNASLLQQCATTPAMYYDVQDVGQLQPVFDTIAAQITGLRIAR